jgi:mannitol-specific phosphotransferase system IIBC component
MTKIVEEVIIVKIMFASHLANVTKIVEPAKNVFMANVFEDGDFKNS